MAFSVLLERHTTVIFGFAICAVTFSIVSPSTSKINERNTVERRDVGVWFMCDKQAKISQTLPNRPNQCGLVRERQRDAQRERERESDWKSTKKSKNYTHTPHHTYTCIHAAHSIWARKKPKHISTFACREKSENCYLVSALREFRSNGIFALQDRNWKLRWK